MATRNIVPRATGEGSIGTSTKKWGQVNAGVGNFTSINASAVNVTGVTYNATATILRADIEGFFSQIDNVGQSASMLLTLCSCDLGIGFSFVVSDTGYQVAFKPQSDDDVYFDGTLITSGNGIVNASPAVADYILFWGFKKGAGYEWIAQSGIGNWVEGAV